MHSQYDQLLFRLIGQLVERCSGIYRGGHGFESRTSLNLFQDFFSFINVTVLQSIFYPQFLYMNFPISHFILFRFVSFCFILLASPGTILRMQGEKIKFKKRDWIGRTLQQREPPARASHCAPGTHRNYSIALPAITIIR